MTAVAQVLTTFVGYTTIKNLRGRETTCGTWSILKLQYSTKQLKRRSGFCTQHLEGADSPFGSTVGLCVLRRAQTMAYIALLQAND